MILNGRLMAVFLQVSDQEGAYTDNTNDVYVIGQMSGLIERPEFNLWGYKES